MSGSIMETPTFYGPIKIVSKYHVSLHTSLTHYMVEAKKVVNSVSCWLCVIMTAFIRNGWTVGS